MNKYVHFLLITCLLFIAIPQKVFGQDSIFDTSASSLFNNEDEFLEPKLAFNFNFNQQADHVQINFDIVDGYYLYKNNFSFKVINATLGEVKLPRGKDYEDEFFGKQEIYDKPLKFSVPVANITNDAQLMIRYQGCAKKGLCYPPEIVSINLLPQQANAQDVFAAIGNDSTLNQANSTTTNPTDSEQHQLADMLAGGNLSLTLLAFFVGGLLLSFTPCVFPMYPILTGIIVGQKQGLSTKRAFSLSFSYVQGMAVTYTLLGIVVALAGAQFQAMFQHPVVLIALSILFIFLALSMFGVFNLALPASWQNKLNNISNGQKSGSYVGVFSMGAISGLVASPCTTAPLTGALLYISQSGDMVLGASALYALSLGMGLPLLVLGSSGGKLLPKAGAWMDVVKNVFGFLLLTVPIFLLDRFLPQAATFALSIVLLIIASIYVIRLNLSHPKSVTRHIISGVIAISIGSAAYQITPENYYPFAKHNTDTKAFTYVSDLAELKLVVAKANENGQTVMVDLYADWCIACKEFEHKTFPKPNVQKALANTLLVQIDLTDTGSAPSKELMKHYDVFGLPSILFFDLTGNELTKSRVTGFMAANEFALHVENALN